MEMPEKWNRLRSYEPQTSHVIEALDLLKEMAEALGDSLDTIHSEVCGQKCHRLHTEPLKILKKFKDGK